MDDLATLQAYLAGAQIAAHQLVIGRREASVSYDGNKSVTFTQADLGKLNAYIGDLTRRIAVLTGDARHRGPVQFTF